MEELITEKDIIMRSGAAAAPPVPDYKIKAPPNQNLDAQLFQILEIGVNTMVEQIKEKLGTNIPDTNSNAKVIMELLNTLKTKIDGDKGINALEASIRVDKDADGKYNITKADGKTPIDHETFNLNNTDNLFRDRDKMKQYMINNNYIDLDFKYYKDDGTKHDNLPALIDVKDTNNIIQVNDRLANCQLLEMLYMIKHEELMKTFAFTLNLFDKYKYAIKIILFLLKNLVKKDPQPTGEATGGPTSIKLPKALIPNIQKLLKDQAIVQEIITSMKATIDDEKLSKLSSGNETNRPSERRVNHDVVHNGSPSDTHDFNAPVPGATDAPFTVQAPAT